MSKCVTLSESHFSSATIGLLAISGFFIFLQVDTFTQLQSEGYELCPPNKTCSHLIWKSSDAPVEASKSTINNHVSLLTYLHSSCFISNTVNEGLVSPFRKFHSRCLAVAYFPPKSRLVLLLNLFLWYSCCLFFCYIWKTKLYLCW